MRTMLWFAGVLAGVGAISAVILAGARPALAYYCEDGQLPAPPEVAAQMALPLCGFAATKRWGPNGCQLCDPRNMHPNPYGYDDRGPRHRHGYRIGQ